MHTGRRRETRSAAIACFDPVAPRSESTAQVSPLAVIAEVERRDPLSDAELRARVMARSPHAASSEADTGWLEAKYAGFSAEERVRAYGLVGQIAFDEAASTWSLWTSRAGTNPGSGGATRNSQR